MGKNEPGVKKFMEYLPLVIIVIAGVSSYATLTTTQTTLISDIEEVETTQDDHDEAIAALKLQGVRVEGKLNRLDEKLVEQRTDTRNILKILRERPR